MCLTGALVVSCPLKQGVAGCAKFESFYCSDIFLFRENSNGLSAGSRFPGDHVEL